MNKSHFYSIGILWTTAPRFQKICKGRAPTSDTSLKAISALGCLFLSGWSCKAAKRAFLTKYERITDCKDYRNIYFNLKYTEFVVLSPNNIYICIFFNLFPPRNRILSNIHSNPEKMASNESRKTTQETYSKKTVPVDERRFNSLVRMLVRAGNGAWGNGDNFQHQLGFEICLFFSNSSHWQTNGNRRFGGKGETNAETRKE